MATIGAVLSSFSLGTSVLAVIAAIWGIKTRRDNIILLSRQIAFLHFLVLFGAVLALVGLLYKSDFSVVYVTNNVNRALPGFYRFTSLWAGQAGSLLWWNFLMVTFSVIAIWQIQKKQPVFVPYMVAILMGTSFFFCYISNFSDGSDSFEVFTGPAGALVTQADGRGLNPLLQHWAMIIHPPILYLGYVSFAIPFAIAMAALLSRQVNLDWTRLVRRWTLFSWFFLGTGILLGGKWAYEELGWGGYWGWDPVENASLVPWLTGTAFLHSIIVQEKRGVFKVWNMFLVSFSFFCCILGTAATRTGIVSSVHAFARSDLGPHFAIFLLIIALFSAWAIIKNRDILKPDHHLNSLLSREVGFLFNNILLLFSALVIIVGVAYAPVTELFGQRVELSAAWYNKIMSPVGLGILFLTGCGPLLAWRKTASRTLVKNFRLPLAIGVFTFAIFAAARAMNDLPPAWMATTSFALVAFVISGVLEEFFRAASNRTSYTREPLFVGFIMILFQNKRRYLGYMVHLGIAILFIGFTGKSFEKKAKLTLMPGELETFAGYQIEVAKFERSFYPPDLKAGEKPLYETEKLLIKVYEDHKLRDADTTEVRTYPMYDPRTDSYDTQRTSEPAIMPSFYDDVYVQYAAIEPDGRMALQVWVNPLVSLVWLGFIFIVIFGLILLLPIGERRTMKIAGREYSVQPQAARA